MRSRPVNRFNIRKMLVRGAAATVLFVLLWYVISLTYAYVNQDGLIFFTRPVSAQSVQILKAQDSIEELNLETPDGNTLRGWLVNAVPGRKKPLVMYFGGNAEEVSGMVNTAKQMSGSSWALVNYRGYGASTGRPSETHLFQDALLVYDTLSTREDIDTKNISVFGKSLGGGVAVHVASERPVSRLLLTTPYDSVVNVAQEQYPYLPVGLLLRHKFDSLARAGDISVPVLILAAGNDEMIPPAHAANLADAFGSNCTFRIIPGEGHNTIVANPGYLSAVRDFLGSQ